MTKLGGREALKDLIYSSPVRKEFTQWLFGEFMAKITQEPDLIKSFLAIEFYNLAKTMTVPIDATSLPNRADYQAGIVGLSWSDPNKDDDFRGWGRYLQAKCREEIHIATSNPNPKTVLEYANYAEPGDLTDRTVFGLNQKRLTQLKTKCYDPQHLFHKANLITPPAAPV